VARTRYSDVGTKKGHSYREDRDMGRDGQGEPRPSRASGCGTCACGHPLRYDLEVDRAAATMDIHKHGGGDGGS
jgi:hypothetical protein